MVVDAVCSEPVSGRNSLVIGKITGIPEKINEIGLFQRVFPQQILAFLDKFPARQNREFHLSACEEQGTLAVVSENYLT